MGQVSKPSTPQDNMPTTNDRTARSLGTCRRARRISRRLFPSRLFGDWTEHEEHVFSSFAISLASTAISLATTRLFVVAAHRASTTSLEHRYHRYCHMYICISIKLLSYQIIMSLQWNYSGDHLSLVVHTLVDHFVWKQGLNWMTHILGVV